MVTAKLSCKVNSAAHVGYRDNTEILTFSVLIRVIDDLETGPRVQVSERTIKAQLAAHRHVMAGFAARANIMKCQMLRSLPDLDYRKPCVSILSQPTRYVRAIDKCPRATAKLALSLFFIFSSCSPLLLHLLSPCHFFFFFVMITLSILSAAVLVPLVFAARDPPVFTLDCSTATGYPEACETHW